MQLFFHDPDHNMLEACNCNCVPIELLQGSRRVPQRHLPAHVDTHQPQAADGAALGRAQICCPAQQQRSSGAAGKAGAAKLAESSGARSGGARERRSIDESALRGQGCIGSQRSCNAMRTPQPAALAVCASAPASLAQWRAMPLWTHASKPHNGQLPQIGSRCSSCGSLSASTLAAYASVSDAYLSHSGNELPGDTIDAATTEPQHIQHIGACVGHSAESEGTEACAHMSHSSLHGSGSFTALEAAVDAVIAQACGEAA